MCKVLYFAQWILRGLSCILCRSRQDNMYLNSLPCALTRSLLLALCKILESDRCCASSALSLQMLELLQGPTRGIYARHEAAKASPRRPGRHGCHRVCRQASFFARMLCGTLDPLSLASASTSCFDRCAVFVYCGGAC